ncbi:ScbA/BarX family gamma-butyrolactone biosynthesis protein [Nocardiopsis sp. NRRL B-16309]|uniref:ScbA/BarX family gamma-butyrolactone biosynthesis protein n=1 Tax=Nocardiopsis sp. NRRL B-16309 TaxID=1519494 RepID=UPI0006ADEB10|nr:ScbA/BarX family gamma-butyrolactone biosynthesis protein [Nocardiopsis sp. NRRL B-16309]KOX12619.1 A-factor biosynthesis protein [Nocardiopsis sp. NRRL B-16309]
MQMPVHPLLTGDTAATRTDDPRLDYVRTLDRTVVHRESLAEVFVTDTQSLGDDAHAAASQLPRSHAYYGDHLLRPRRHDPVLLLEACRQVGLAIAHTHYGVPFDHKFVLTSLGISITRPERMAVGSAPCELRMLCSVEDKRVKEGRVVGYDARFRLFVDGTEVGNALVGLRFKSPESYRALRLRNREGAPVPSTATFDFTVAGEVPTPYLVGRTSNDNVVLAGLAGDGDTASASLRVLPHHPSLFDHAQDHLPGMVLVEAGRQLALNTLLEAQGTSPAKAYPAEITASFTSFGELEPRTDLRARVVPANEPAHGVYYTQGGVVEFLASGDGDGTGPTAVEVDVLQGGASICRMDVGLVRFPS